MDDVRELIAVQQELKGISDRLRNIFPSTHTKFDRVFEDLGAALWLGITDFERINAAPTTKTHIQRR